MNDTAHGFGFGAEVFSESLFEEVLPTTDDAPEDDDGQLGLAELDEKDSKGLSTGQRAELADGAVLEFFRFLVLEAEFVGIIFESEFFKIVIFNRPVEFSAEVGDEVFEVGDGAEVGRHGEVKAEKLE